jgi:hypothetical protein
MRLSRIVSHAGLLALAASISGGAPAGLVAADGPATASPTASPAGDYLGQRLPGETPELFAPGIVSTGLFERDLAITPDGSEIFFSVAVGSRYEFNAIFTSRRVDGRWSDPEPALFADSTRYDELEPWMTPGGSRLYFVTNRPHDGADGEKTDEDIWFVERTAEGWSEAQHLGAPVDSEAKEYFPSVTRDGTIYFTREGPKSPRGLILRSRLVDGVFQEPEPLPEVINAAGAARFNASIAPDESFLILPIWGRDDSLGGADYYVLFRSPDDRWSEPIHLPAGINSENGQEYSASFSPDGRYLFFMSARTLDRATLGPRFTNAGLRAIQLRPGNGNADIYWVRADFIESLRPPGFTRTAK